MRTILLLTIFLHGCLLMLAQKWTPRYIGITSTTHGYYEYLPQGYRSDGLAVYPLILYIHGNSERGKGDSVDLLKIIGGGLPKVMTGTGFPLSFNVNTHVYRFIVIAPQFEPRVNVIDVDSVLNYVLKHYPVDRNRIYLTGFSMGGGACWDYAGSVPALTNKLAALVPVSGSGIPDTIKTRTIARANLPVWATHNDEDPQVPVSTTNTYISWINEAPAPTPLARKTIFHSTSHNAWAATYNPIYKENGTNVFEWMLQYQHRPVPLTTVKQLKANLYGGLYAYTNVQWNNWNVADTLTSGKLHYNDATASAIQATLSKSSGVSDNGLSYGGVMAPAEVLRYVSGAASARTLTLSGLSTSNSYNLELYASRNSGSGYITTFTVNGSSQNISTYKNLTNKAVFTNLKASTSGQVIVGINNANAYNYLNGFALTETISTPNQLPVANAGADKSITLPTNSIMLSGSGSDKDGFVKSYKWAKGAGPVPFTICSATSATTFVGGLVPGIYTFQLTVTDNQGATAIDEVQVTVKPASTKYIRVNLYGGTNAYVNKEWNNWNVLSNLTATAFRYSDGSASTISGTIQRNGVQDNSTSYGGCIVPPEVLRYTCYASASRTLTLTGLSASKTYNLELYASRNANSDDSTVFTINGVSKKMATYQNRTHAVLFTGLVANARGQIILTLSGTKTYNYLNGFTITEMPNTSVTRVLPVRNSGVPIKHAGDNVY